MSNLQNEISSLSTAEKFELLDALWESLEADLIVAWRGMSRILRM
jgi:putative addiction module component